MRMRTDTAVGERARVLGADEVAERIEMPGPGARSFDLPPRLTIAMVGVFFAYVLILFGAFGAGHGMGLVLGIILIQCAAFFGVPRLFVRVKTGETKPDRRWALFRERGFETITGHTSARETTVLVLLMPMVMLAWAIAMAMLGHAVRH